MAYFEDVGTVIYAPIEFIWAYLVSPHHAPAHAKSARGFTVRETAGATSVVASERRLGGRWSPVVSRTTDFPPFCVLNEEIEGEFQGSKFVLVYRPSGTKTRIDVYGDVQSRGSEPAEARRTFLRMLGQAYREDAAVIAHLRERSEPE